MQNFMDAYLCLPVKLNDSFNSCFLKSPFFSPNITTLFADSGTNNG